jgi:hypothetical protein
MPFRVTAFAAAGDEHSMEKVAAALVAAVMIFTGSHPTP